ncbi:hypothetical protein [Sinorhizobium medicae]|uniref:hypothetical protein n=1 Tax=Sinorhizobium medicae TaxID=110321 RepID=UPI001D20470E|nr:hypothetical protein [Sinorhizobium medicae]PLU02687.1 hypothetical protein BMJ32_12120 [Sinorhizobium medicae]PLU57139.1 hypothetical protein BMJ23_11135 [Sinorhizobium medicae]PLU79400.1 hypothetical protein BMJ22_18405 [Sinorhizobium medicae]
MTLPAIHTFTLPGAMLKRGFWLYVWRAQTPAGEMLYVGRTGDNSSPYATAPYTRMGQHLGKVQTQNALRKHLQNKGIDPESCSEFDLIACGPLYPEVEGEGLDRSALMELHKPIRNIVGAMEKALAYALQDVGYCILNTVSWNHPLDDRLWQPVLKAFSDHFPRLSAFRGIGVNG